MLWLDPGGSDEPERHSIFFFNTKYIWTIFNLYICFLYSNHVWACIWDDGIDV